MKRRARELRHLRLAFFHDPLEFLGAELASIGAHEYPILEVVWHTFAPFYISSSYGSPLKPDGCFENCGQMCISQNSTTLFFSEILDPELAEEELPPRRHGDAEEILS